jgi:hypothetical protein
MLLLLDKILARYQGYYMTYQLKISSINLQLANQTLNNLIQKNSLLRGRHKLSEEISN